MPETSPSDSTRQFSSVKALGCLKHTLPEEGEAGSPIALAFHELQAMDLAFGDAVAPLEREPPR